MCVMERELCTYVPALVPGALSQYTDGARDVKLDGGDRWAGCDELEAKKKNKAMMLGKTEECILTAKNVC